jgi:cytochrome bd-type quinol oxidase subunit 1
MLPRRHLLCGLPVIVAGFTGSLFVLAVNAWMNNPSGFRIEDGRAVDVQPWEALFGNAYLWPELTHMYLAGFIVTGFLLASAYALGWLRGRRGRYERTALIVPLTIATLAAPVQLVVGDWIARTVGDQQPTKLAAFEGLEQTTRGARRSTCWAGTTTVRSATASRSPSCSRCWPSTTRRRRSVASTPSRRRTARRSTSCASPSRRWWGSAPCWPRCRSCT